MTEWVLPAVMVLLGIGIVVRTLARRRRPGVGRAALRVLLAIAGGLRIWVERRRRSL